VPLTLTTVVTQRSILCTTWPAPFFTTTSEMVRVQSATAVPLRPCATVRAVADTRPMATDPWASTSTVTPSAVAELCASTPRDGSRFTRLL
jgi:hypothetical protein